MKNKTKGVLIDLCALVLTVTAFVLLNLFVIKKFELKPLNVFLYSVLGLVINYFLGVFFHETGHLIFAKHNKMVAIKINFGVLSIDYRSSKKIKVFTLFGENAGESNFVPSESFTEKTAKQVAFGGIMFNLVYCIIALVLGLVVYSPVTFCLFAIGSLSAWYLFLINVLPFDKTSDGAMVFSKNGYARAVATICEIQRQILMGETLSFPDHVKTSTEPLDVYCDFLRIVQTDANDALKRIGVLQNNFDLTAQEYELIFPETLFNACIGGFLSEELKLRSENFYSQNAKTLAELRAHYAYRVVLGETAWANAILSEYNNQLKNANSFEKQIENALFSCFEQSIKTQ